ncbi:MAG: four helix bundle protein [Bacteroidales bacterium]|jgi:four helix bundle protein
MNSSDLQNRSKKFAIEVINLAELLPNRPTGWIIGKQIIRSATSVAANYRAVCRARSDKEFIAKMGIVIEESDETLFWLELIEEAKIIPQQPETNKLKKEANELTSIFVSSVKTVKARLSNKKKK